MFLFNVILLGRYLKKFSSQPPFLMKLLVYHTKPRFLSPCTIRTATNTKATTSNALQKLTGWTDDEIAKVWHEYPLLKERKISDMIEIYNLLTKEYVTEQQIRRSPWLLMDERSALIVKVSVIKKLGVSINEDTIPLLSASVFKLKAVKSIIAREKVNSLNALNGILFLHKNLKIHMGELLRVIYQNHFYLVNVNFSKINTVINGLISSGVSPEYIRNYLWIFRYDEEIIFKRVKQIHDFNSPLMPSMLCCSEEEFSVLLDSIKKALEVLGPHKDNIDYLAYRLNCSRDHIQKCCIKYPRICKLHPWRIKEMLDFLLGRNIATEEICMTPRIFISNLDTIKKRVKDFEEMQYHLVSLRVMCCSRRKYQKLLRKFEFPTKQ